MLQCRAHAVVGDHDSCGGRLVPLVSDALRGCRCSGRRCLCGRERPPISIPSLITDANHQMTLQRLGVLPPPPTPEPPRPPRPSPLTPSQVARLKLVIFLPSPELGLSSDSNLSSVPASPRIDPAKLAYPAIYLREEQTTCAVCQETFAPPKAILGVAVSADPLRQLPCEHVYHVSTALPVKHLGVDTSAIALMSGCSEEVAVVRLVIDL